MISNRTRPIISILVWFILQVFVEILSHSRHKWSTLNVFFVFFINFLRKVFVINIDSFWSIILGLIFIITRKHLTLIYPKYLNLFLLSFLFVFSDATESQYWKQTVNWNSRKRVILPYLLFGKADLAFMMMFWIFLFILRIDVVIYYFLVIVWHNINFFRL